MSPSQKNKRNMKCTGEERDPRCQWSDSDKAHISACLRLENCRHWLSDELVRNSHLIRTDLHNILQQQCVAPRLDTAKYGGIKVGLPGICRREELHPSWLTQVSSWSWRIWQGFMSLCHLHMLVWYHLLCISMPVCVCIKQWCRSKFQATVTIDADSLLHPVC